MKILSQYLITLDTSIVGQDKEVMRLLRQAIDTPKKRQKYKDEEKRFLNKMIDRGDYMTRLETFSHDNTRKPYLDKYKI